MKFISLFIISLLITQASFSQINIDERRFAIDLFQGDRHDYFDTLDFSNGNLSYGTARKYGFQPAAYKVKEKKDRSLVGTALNESKTNGTMLWNFVIMNDSIAGTASFDSRVRNPVNYTFAGKELK